MDRASLAVLRERGSVNEPGILRMPTYLQICRFATRLLIAPPASSAPSPSGPRDATSDTEVCPRPWTSPGVSRSPPFAGGVAAGERVPPSAGRPRVAEFVGTSVARADTFRVRGSNRLPRRALVAFAGSSLFAAGPASARVVFPTPGAMSVPDLPKHVRAGEHLTLVENMPDGILGGVVHFQRESPAGLWGTMASAPVRPWVFWLHWHVPRRWAGSQIQVRFLLTDAGQFLAGSPVYSMSIKG